MTQSRADTTYIKNSKRNRFGEPQKVIRIRHAQIKTSINVYKVPKQWRPVSFKTKSSVNLIGCVPTKPYICESHPCDKLNNLIRVVIHEKVTLAFREQTFSDNSPIMVWSVDNAIHKTHSDTLVGTNGQTIPKYRMDAQMPISTAKGHRNTT